MYIKQNNFYNVLHKVWNNVLYKVWKNMLLVFLTITTFNKKMKFTFELCLTPIQQFSAISWREQVNFQ